MSLSAEEYGQKIGATIHEGFHSLLLAVGYKLKLFDHLGNENEPKTSEQIAHSAQLKERYVREWLNAMVVSGFVECDPTGKTYWLTSAAKEALKNDLVNIFLTQTVFVPMLSLVFNQVLDCFKLDGPSGISYSSYGQFYDVIAGFFEPIRKATLVPHLVPAVPGFQEKLEKGITCLDVGCGKGKVSLLLAETFPQSQFYGVDLSLESIDLATLAGRKQSLSNVQFSACDATTLPNEWISKFDYVTTFDVIHDLARPDLVLLEIFRMLKPGGHFLMVDIYGDSNVYKNKKDVKSTFLYTTSLFHCMPVSLYFPNGMGLGNQWGIQKAMAMLKDVGFDNIQMIDTPWDPTKLNAIYLCKKAE